jgi:hypothetical protein
LFQRPLYQIQVPSVGEQHACSTIDVGEPESVQYVDIVELRDHVVAKNLRSEF